MTYNISELYLPQRYYTYDVNIILSKKLRIIHAFKYIIIATSNIQSNIH